MGITTSTKPFVVDDPFFGSSSDGLSRSRPSVAGPREVRVNNQPVTSYAGIITDRGLVNVEKDPFVETLFGHSHMSIVSKIQQVVRGPLRRNHLDNMKEALVYMADEISMKVIPEDTVQTLSKRVVEICAYQEVALGEALVNSSLEMQDVLEGEVSIFYKASRIAAIFAKEKLQEVQQLNLSNGKVYAFSSWTPYTSLRSFLGLRALNLQQNALVQVPTAVSHLPCLEYLDLSNTAIVELPVTMIKMSNLSRLILANCTEIRFIPLSLKHKLSRLLRLDARGTPEFFVTHNGEIVGRETFATFVEKR